MKGKLYPKPLPGILLFLLFQAGILSPLFAQNCRELSATYTTSESRCKATGSITVTPSGGSGTYNYKVAGPVNPDFTSSNVITGLPSGTYTVTVKDIVYNCTFQIANVVLPGSYIEPRFGITETDVTCQNGSDGIISVSALQNGLAPYTYKLVAPSPMGVGTTNSTGTFTGLTPGTYSVQLTDSCGAIQTRSISIQNYSWSISSSAVTNISCTQYTGQLTLKDSKGNLNTSGNAFNGYQYGVVNAAGDTSWFTTNSFNFDLGQKRSVTLVAKDRCGGVKTTSWNNTLIPSAAGSATTSNPTCTGFDAAITSQKNLTSPQFCLVDLCGNAVPGQPCNPSGSFTNIPYGGYRIIVTNTCYDTTFSRSFSMSRTAPTVTGTATVSNYTCTDVTLTAASQHTTNPLYCLINSSGVQVGGCNNNGIFNNVPYGSYTIRVTDGCTGTVLNVTANATKRIRKVDDNVSYSTAGCNTESVKVTNPSSGWTNPKYCLTDASGNPIPGVACNNTGQFTNLPYGSYCINITDDCQDTVVKRCFTMTRPATSAGTVAFSNDNCTGFTIKVNGAVLYNAQYCLTDQAGNAIPGFACNTSGTFNNVPYGSYCVHMKDLCTGDDYPYCFTRQKQTPSVGPITTSSVTCSGFTATVSNQKNLNSPSFCLFDNQGNQIGTCINNGIFNITGFGTYTIRTTDGCTGTVFTSSVTVTKPVSAIDANLKITAKTCTGFTAAVTGMTNLAGGHYYLKDQSGNTLQDNTNGTFTNVPYGYFCINAVNACLDTTISRCMTVSPDPTQVTITAKPSCTYMSSDLTVNVTSGLAPYTVYIYDTLHNLLKTVTSSSTSITIPSLPSIALMQRFFITTAAACGASTSQYVTSTPSNVSHVYTITPKCPSSISQNGSSDLSVTATTNLPGGVGLSITQKDFSPVSIGYSNSSGNTYLFSSLDAATYVITYTFTGCTTTINDTLVLPQYAYPSLAKSAAYQCDNNSFSIGAAVTGGIGPFTYQVIGSTPSTPSINTSAQANPVFSIENGVQYSLVRLRAIDACGNSALNDVSILPLANTIITSTSDCPYTTSVLSVGNTPNATYTWYKKTSATDSTLLGTDPTYTINSIGIPDTGLYVNRMSVNNGCLTKISYFNVHGTCNGMVVLPAATVLRGMVMTDGSNQLTWPVAADEGSISQYVIESSDRADGQFSAIGSQNAYTYDPNGASTHTFLDKTPRQTAGNANAYRLMIVYASGQTSYSNVIVLRAGKADPIIIYPNPASDLLNIAIQADNAQLLLTLYSTTGQIIYQDMLKGSASNVFTYHRTPSVKTGMYFLRVNNLTTGDSKIFKIMFQ